MPSQNIQVGLQFTADTSNASRQVAKLKDEISQAIQNVNNPKTGSLNFESAINQAAQLRGILDAATTDTGKLDLSKFQRGLAAAGLDMQKVYSSLHAIGAEDAFGRLANQINQANIKSEILSGTLRKFATGLKNTAMWTIQSNAIHAVQGALQGAFSYAQKLNKGLTDISIVSDLTSDQLAAFAKNANAAAKELSATTNEYVKGALIYYQQGLNDEEVAKRTETTIKMANASGESAETISSYMTAIWNNFDKGSESVEHYADVIALLGATTAASNADIAEGMQAFAATAETVGLSYEYSAAALTTLVDRTQQSASKIGTSLKTIFARLSSVSLGETLEDDVNLTKYTKALEKVGVDVLTATGDLKDMNSILDELGAKWDSLNQAQKVAVAQTVGGVRQYNNLISLLDNYDFFKDLVSEAEDADGYLQTQQDKYAASWEGANKRVQASWETLYSQLLDDKFFIKLTNTLADIIDFITDAIDGMGGLKGILSTIIALVSSINPEKFEAGIVRATEAVRGLAAELSGAQAKANIELKTDNLQIALGKNIANGEYADKINGMYEQIQTWVAKINELQAKGDTAHASALLQITERYSALADKAIQYNNARESAVQQLYNTELPSDVIDKIVSQKGTKDTQLNGYQNLYNDLQSGDLQQKRSILADLQNTQGQTYGLKGWGLLGLDNLIPKNLGQLGQAEIEKIFNQLQSLIEGRIQKLASKLGPAWEKLFDIKGDLTKLPKEQILKMFESGEDGIQEAIAGSLQKAAEQNAAERQAVQAELELSTAAAEMGAPESARTAELNDQLQNLESQRSDIQAIIELIQQKVRAESGVNRQLEAGKTLLKEQEQEQEKINAKKFDMQQFATNMRSITQLTSSMTMLNSAADGLYKTIKEDSLSIGSLTGTITTAAGSLPMMAMGLKSVTTMLEGTALAGSKFISVLGGPWGLVIAGLIAILPTLVKWMEDAFGSPSIEEQLEETNEKLSHQKEIITSLTSDYNSLSSEVNHLTSAYEELTNAELGLDKSSPDYWIKRAEYIEKVQELIDKYGASIASFDERSGLYIIDENAIKQSMLNTINFAKQEEDILQAQKKRLELEKLNQQDIRQDVKDEARSSYGLKEKISDLWNGSNGVAGQAEVAQTIFARIKQQIQNGDYDIAAVKNDKDWQGLDEEVQNVLYKKIEEYLQAFADASSSPDMQWDDIHTALAGTGILSGAEEYGYSQNQLNGAAEEYTRQLYASNSDYYIEQAKQSYAAAHANDGVSYENGNLYSLDENGEKQLEQWDQETSDAMGMAQAQAEVATAIQQLDTDVVNAILQSGSLQQNAHADDIMNYATGQQIEADRLAGAQQDTETLGLDAQEVSQVADAVNTLIEAEEGLEEAEKRINPVTKAHEGSLKKLANAAEKTQEGYDELEEGYKDWYDAIKGGDELAKAKAMTKLKDSLGDIIGVTDELAESGMHLGEHFGEYLANNQDVVEGALAGDSDAILKLQEVAAEDIAIQIGVDPEADAKLLSEVGNSMDLVQSMLDSGDLKLGTVDNADLLNSLTQTINAIDMDVNQAEALLASMGFDAEVEKSDSTTNHQAAYWVPATYTFNKDNDVGFTEATVATEGHWETVDTPVTDEHTALRIKTADYVGGGNILGASGGTPAGHNRVNNAKGKGKNGGGGGGGGGQKKKAKKAERYHEINDQLDQQSKKIKEIQTKEDRAFGKRADNLIDQHIDALKDEAELYQKLADEAERYLDSDKKKLVNKYNAQFNEDGTIKNYEKWYNDWAKTLKDDDEALQKFEESIKNYEESLDKVIDAKQSQIDKVNEAYDLALKKINDRLDRQKALIEDNLKLLEYEFNRLKDDGSDAAAAIANLSSQMIQYVNESKKYTKAIKDTLKEAGASTKEINQFLAGNISLDDLAKKLNLTPEAVDNLRDYANGLLEVNENLFKLREEAIEQVGKSLDYAEERFNRASRRLEYYTNRLSHLRNVIDIVGQEALGVKDELLNGLAQAQVANSTREVEIAQANVKNLRKEAEELKERRANGDLKNLSAEEYNELSWDVNERLRNAVEDLQSKEEAALQAASDAFETHLNTVVNGFEKAMAGPYKTLDNLQQAYDQQKKLNELYADDYKKIHDLSKLGRDIQKSMDNTQNVKAMEYLKELQDEVNDGLREGNKLTEYDLEFLEKKYQLRLAEIALEEAQNAKNQVRMSRTSEGDWSYVYYADQDKQAEAMQNYEDKLYELEQLNQEHIKEVNDWIMENVKAYADSIRDLNVSDAERIEMIKKYYKELQEKYGIFLTKALNDGQWIEQEFGVIDHNLVNDWDETVLGMTTGFGTLQDFQKTFFDSSIEMTTGVNEAYDEWEVNWKAILDAAGEDAENYSKTVKKTMRLVENRAEKVVDKYKKKLPKLKDAYDEALTQLQGFVDKWKKKAKKLIDKNEEITKSIFDIIKAYEKLGNTKVTVPKVSKPSNNNNNKNNNNKNNNNNNNNTGGNNTPSGSNAPKTTTKTTTPKVVKPGSSNDNTQTYDRNNTSIGKGNRRGFFATGGYTGEWGNEGRLAVLHEKELVLNKTDTSNILTAVKTIREISSQLSNNAQIQAAGFGELRTKGIDLGAQFEQVVNINANFPDAVYHDEIRMAFEELANQASQYIGRK